MMEYKLFPGCVIQNRIPFIEASGKFVLDKLGIKVSPGEFACCPNPVGLRVSDLISWNVLAARNLVEAEKESKPILSLCNGCYQSLKMANHELKHDPILKNKVNAVLSKVGKEFKGSIEVEHFVHILYEKIGIDKIKAAVTRPLSDLKVAVHPGCHYMRPSHILKSGDDPEHPYYLKELVKATGAQLVEYDLELLCCGNSVRSADEYTANTMLRDKIRAARKAGADCIAVNCPACFQQFDMEQRKLAKMSGNEEGEKFDMPVVFITELLALAMGKTGNDIGIKFHRAKNKEFLAKVK